MSAVVPFVARRDRQAFYPALLATTCLAIAFFVVWLGFTNAVNAQTAKWTQIRCRLTGVRGALNGNSHMRRALFFT